MDKYPLAKLVEWAGPDGLNGRKRLQKVVFFLQNAGCPFGAEYALHHYGPYSRDVAETCDELVATGLFVENPATNAVGTQYTYEVTPSGAAALARAEHRLGLSAAHIDTFQPLARELLKRDLWELELGSTVLFFYSKVGDWDEAVRRACEFKKVDRRANASVQAAETLAKKVARVDSLPLK